jgi:hypothetical protein
MAKKIRLESTGKTYSLPDEATPEQIQEFVDYMNSQAKQDSSSSSSKTSQPQSALQEIGQYALNRAADFNQGVVSAVPKLGQFVLRGVAQGLDKLGIPTSALTPALNYDWDKATSSIGSGEQGIGPSIAKGLGSSVPYAMAGGESILGQMLSGSVQGAAETPKGGNDVMGALIGADAPGGVALAGNLAKAIKPSSLLRGKLSDQQLAQNLAQAQGTKTALGDVINNTALKGANDLNQHIWFSGAPDSSEVVANQVKQKANDFMSNVLGDNSDEDIGAQLRDAVKQTKSKIKKQKDANYDLLNEAADSSGAQVGRQSFSNTATNILNDVKQSPELEREFPSDIKGALQLYSDPEREESFKTTDLVRSRLGKKADEYFRKGESYEGGIYSQLKNSLENDVNSAIDESGNPELKTLRDNAHNFYRENYAPFKDPDVMKFLEKKGDPDLLVNAFVKTGRTNDRGRLLSKLMDKLPDDKKGLVPAAYYGRAINKTTGEMDPGKFATLHNALGPEQKKVMLQDPALRKQADDITGLAAMNKEAITAGVDPKTGNKLKKAIPYAIAAAGAKHGALVGGPLGSALGAALYTGVAGTAGKLTDIALRNEKIRKNLVKAMLNKTPKPEVTKKGIAANAITQGLINASRGN